MFDKSQKGQVLINVALYKICVIGKQLSLALKLNFKDS